MTAPGRDLTPQAIAAASEPLKQLFDGLSVPKFEQEVPPDTRKALLTLCGTLEQALSTARLLSGLAPFSPDALPPPCEVLLENGRTVLNPSDFLPALETGMAARFLNALSNPQLGELFSRTQIEQVTANGQEAAVIDALKYFAYQAADPAAAVVVIKYLSREGIQELSLFIADIYVRPTRAPDESKRLMENQGDVIHACLGHLPPVIAREVLRKVLDEGELGIRELIHSSDKYFQNHGHLLARIDSICHDQGASTTKEIDFCKFLITYIDRGDCVSKAGTLKELFPRIETDLIRREIVKELGRIGTSNADFNFLYSVASEHPELASECGAAADKVLKGQHMGLGEFIRGVFIKKFGWPAGSSVKNTTPQ